MTKKIHPDIVIPILITFFIGINLLISFPQLRAYQNKIPRSSLTEPFDSFQKIVRGQPAIGYQGPDTMTDTELALFLQTQFALAPTVVELNRMDAPFVIINTKNTEELTRILRTIPGTIVAHNRYGQGLIERTF